MTRFDDEYNQLVRHRAHCLRMKALFFRALVTVALLFIAGVALSAWCRS